MYCQASPTTAGLRVLEPSSCNADSGLGRNLIISNVTDLGIKDHGQLGISSSSYSPDSCRVECPVFGVLPPDKSSHFPPNIKIINVDLRLFPDSSFRLPPFPYQLFISQKLCLLHPTLLQIQECHQQTCTKYTQSKQKVERRTIVAVWTCIDDG